MPSLVPSVPITLDRERNLRLDNAALFRAERELSKVWNRKVSVLQTLIDPETLGLNDLSILLWCGLLHEDSDLSLSQVQDAMTVQNFATYLDALYTAWNAATAPAEGAPMQESSASPFPSASPGNATGALRVSSLA